MIMSFHVGDISVRQAVQAFRCAPERSEVPGLRQADVSLAAPLSSRPVPQPSLHRVALVAVWDDDEALDDYMEAGVLPGLLAHGWHVRLSPVRVSGSWPGVTGVPAAGRLDLTEGPVAVLTLGRLRARRAVAFFRASARAEGQILRSPGLIWATGMGRPPFVGTCSLWRDTTSLIDFAYRSAASAHGSAMTADRLEPFHHTSAFIRLQPYRTVGGLSGKNPLSSAWIEPDRVARTGAVTPAT